MSTAPSKTVRFKDILRIFENSLHISPIFRSKITNVPLNLDHPYWAEDPDFDIEFHVRHIALPKPGDWRQLCIQVARLQSRPLDMTRPLWEAYVIEGLDNVEGLPKGCYALFVKVHHSCIDGTSGVQLINTIHDMKAISVDDKLSRMKVHEQDTNSPLSDTEILWRATKYNLTTPSRMYNLVKSGIPALLRSETSKKRLGIVDEAITRTRFNDEISPHRVFGAVSFDFQDIRGIKSAFEGVTVNDVVLTIIGGAMRLYLTSKGEPPAKSLVTGAPINVRDESETNSGGNVISMMKVSLCTDIIDSIERLLAVNRKSLASKAYTHAVGAKLMTEIASELPSLLTSLGLRAAALVGINSGRNPMVNTVITNVPGPQVPLFMGGSKLVKSFGASPVTDGIGIIHPVGSYNGEMVISFQACRELMPDPGFYEECLNIQFQDLKSAVAERLNTVSQSQQVKSGII